MAAGPSWVLHTQTTRPHTPRKPVALAIKTDPSFAPGASGGFLTSEADLLMLAFPGVGGLLAPPPFPPGLPSAEPEIHPCALEMPSPGLSGRSFGKRTQTPLGDLAGEGATGNDPQVPGKPHAGTVWLWCLDQTLRRESLESLSSLSHQHEV